VTQQPPVWTWPVILTLCLSLSSFAVFAALAMARVLDNPKAVSSQPAAKKNTKRWSAVGFAHAVEKW
jgi:hypothetical protein